MSDEVDVVYVTIAAQVTEVVDVTINGQVVEVVDVVIHDHDSLEARIAAIESYLGL